MRMIRLLLAWTMLAALAQPPMPAAGGASTVVWFVLSREDGCVPLGVLVRGDRLPRVPVSPDDYAELMRARGHQVTVGPAPGFPPELIGKVVMVTIRSDRAPIFVQSDVCRAGGR